MNDVHVSVLREEVLSYLAPHPGGTYIDATADGGGHALAILEAIRPGGRLLALEWDPDLFRILGNRLKKEWPAYSKNYLLLQESFAHLGRLSKQAGFAPAAGVLFDLGMSSYHLEASKRGFSFQKDEILDMRFNPGAGEPASMLLKRISKEELARILKDFGGERFAGRIAESIVRRRKDHPIRTTRDLVQAIARAVPRRQSGIHFATRSFQALRIAVNREFDAIRAGLEGAWEVLAPGGRIVIISFHSGEDGLVKRFFREAVRKSSVRELTTAPVSAGRSEIVQNPRARSARLRAYEKFQHTP